MPLTDEQVEKIKLLHEQIGPYQPLEPEASMEPAADPVGESVMWIISLILRLNRDVEDLAERVNKLEEASSE